MNYVGYVDETNRFFVAGWVADQDDWQKALRVDILVNGQPQGYAFATDFRQGLLKVDPSSTGKYAFRYYFADPLSMHRDHEITVRASGTTFFLTELSPPISAVTPDRNLSAQRPGGPILLSTSGCTGSTAVMAELAQHPNIVVAGDRPFEVELGCYYAYALRTLSAAGDQTRSLATDRITATENRFHIGFNPYFDHAFSTVFKTPATLKHFLSAQVPARVSGAFREIILDYYQLIATDQGISHPLYFAEKSLPERDARLGVRFMFPNVREILLVRDLRDILCSSMATKNAQFAPILEAAKSAGKQFVRILDEDRPDVLLLKYEDYVLRHEETAAELYRFLGLASITPEQSKARALFDVHATSANPAASIGRWKHDLSTEQQKECDVLTPYLERLGYA